MVSYASQLLLFFIKGLLIPDGGIMEYNKNWQFYDILTTFEKTAGQIKTNLFIYLDYKVKQKDYADIFEICIFFYFMALPNFKFCLK